MCYVPQSDNVFPSLTIQENLEMGAFIRRDDYRAQMQKIFELFPDLAERRAHAGGQAVGRAAADAGPGPRPDAGAARPPPR